MIRRLFLFILATALLIAAAVWLANRPGEVVIHWQGWRIDTSVPVIVLILLVLAAVSVVLARLVWGVIAAPGRFLAARRARRLHAGYQALSDGLAAVSVGDSRAARKLARRADTLLAGAPVTGLLTARAADLNGDTQEAERRFQAMVDRPETAFAGLDGLMTLALRRGDRDEALNYARRAWALNPGAPGLAAPLFDLQVRSGQWAEAEQTLADVRRQASLPAADIRHRHALVLNQRAEGADGAGDTLLAARLALEAHKADPAFAAATVRAAALLARLGKIRKATATLEAGWRVAPHPALVEAWQALAPAERPLERVKRLTRLVRANPDAAEGHVALGEAALAAKLWGQARTHLETAARLAPSAGVYVLLARLEREEGRDEAKATAWIAKVADAPAEPSWVCGACGAHADVWTVACPSCGAIDTIGWSGPAPRPAGDGGLGA